MSNLLHDAVLEFENTVNENPTLSIVSTRLINLLSESLRFSQHNPTEIEQLAVANDEELLASLATQLSVARAGLSERELRKKKRRLQAEQEFFNKIAELGGYYKPKEIVDFLGVSRQTVNNQRNKGTLLAVKRGNDYVYPAFQFKNDQKLEGFSEVLAELKNMSSSLKCSFFWNPVESSLGELSPLDLLNYHFSETVVHELKKIAASFRQFDGK